MAVRWDGYVTSAKDFVQIALGGTIRCTPGFESDALLRSAAVWKRRGQRRGCQPALLVLRAALRGAILARRLVIGRSLQLRRMLISREPKPPSFLASCKSLLSAFLSHLFSISWAASLLPRVSAQGMASCFCYLPCTMHKFAQVESTMGACIGCGMLLLHACIFRMSADVHLPTCTLCTNTRWSARRHPELRL